MKLNSQRNLGIFETQTVNYIGFPLQLVSVANNNFQSCMKCLEGENSLTQIPISNIDQQSFDWSNCPQQFTFKIYQQHADKIHFHR